MNIKETLFEFSNSTAVGCIRDASDLAFKKLSQFCETERMNNLTVIGTLKGENDHTIMIEAHIDQIAMVVTNIDDEGFVTVAKSGGIDIRTLPAQSVTIHGKKDVKAVFCSTPPHLSTGEIQYEDIAKIKLDTCLGLNAKNFITIGDYVTFDVKADSLLGTRVTGKSFDDRSGVVCLLELADRLQGKQLPCNVALAVCDGEELGMRGSRTATYKIDPNEAIAIDVSFGDGPDISVNDCGKISDGAMIGISPVIDKRISSKLVCIAEDNGFQYQTEIMGGKTGTDADVISLTKCGISCGLVSIPLRNMHTEVEMLDILDIESVCNILEAYILSGGLIND